jgi:Leucine-rich repeat (LRR) protein
MSINILRTVAGVLLVASASGGCNAIVGDFDKKPPVDTDSRNTDSTETEMQTEPSGETDTGTRMVRETDSPTLEDTGTGTEAQIGTDTETGTSPGSDSDTEPTTPTENEMETGDETSSSSETDTATETETETETDTDTDTDTQTDTKTMPPNGTGTLQPCSDPAVFPDTALEDAIREAAERFQGPLCLEHLDAITALDAGGRGISNLTGMGQLVNLNEVDLSDNDITDIAPLVDNPVIGEGDKIILTANPLDCLAGELRAQLTALVARNLSLESDCFNCNMDDVFIPDDTLRGVARSLTGVSEGPIPLSNALDVDEFLLTPNTEPPVWDLSGLECFANLHKLWLTYNEIGDLEPIRGLVGLTDVNLYANPLESLDPLESLSGLEDLFFSGGDITDLTPLEKLTSLHSLDILKTSIADLAPLVANDGLGDGDSITLYDNDNLDCSSGILRMQLNALIARGPHLFHPCFECNLNAEYNFKDEALDAIIRAALELTDGEPVSPDELRTITELEYNGLNNVASLEGMECLVNLTSFTLTSCYITDLEPLRGLEYLTYIEISNDYVTDVSPLAELPNLTSLSIPSNGVTDATSFGALTGLVYLNLSHNSVVDISPLVGLTALDSLNLSYNDITDLSPLIDNEGISGYSDTVYLNGVDDICTAENWERVVALQNRGVYITYDVCP